MQSQCQQTYKSDATTMSFYGFPKAKYWRKVMELSGWSHAVSTSKFVYSYICAFHFIGKSYYSWSYSFNMDHQRQENIQEIARTHIAKLKIWTRHLDNSGHCQTLGKLASIQNWQIFVRSSWTDGINAKIIKITAKATF